MKTILLLLTALVLLSCSKDNKETASEKKPEGTEVINKAPGENYKSAETINAEQKITGYYTGDFIALEYDDSKEYTYRNKITISVDSLAKDTLYGHSIVAGNDRPFKGLFVGTKQGYSAVVNEPGDDKYDGTFSFSIDPAANIIKGTWTSFNKDALVTKREYELVKRDFSYNKDNGLPIDKNWNTLYEQDPKFPDKLETLTGKISEINASNKLLKKSDIDNLFKGDLEVIRNSIYARHGYSFKNRKMRYFFDNHIDWYMPVSTDVRNNLTETELKNVDLLKRFEEHAEKYYDEYGR
ncbi:MAG: YARHG domain-containing protein [bacterium]|nr:YARHG domain-containing protein [bacterium]